MKIDNLLDYHTIIVASEGGGGIVVGNWVKLLSTFKKFKIIGYTKIFRISLFPLTSIFESSIFRGTVDFMLSPPTSWKKFFD